MKKSLSSLLIVLFMSVASGCVTTESMGARDGTDSTLPPSFAQFNDIPIPEKAMMDLKQSLLFGGESAWIGRLVFSAPYTQNGMFDFYMSEMPKFGWTEVTVVRSKVSVLSFRRDTRIATIQLESDIVGGTVVSFTVSPRSEKKTQAAPKPSPVK